MIEELVPSVLGMLTASPGKAATASFVWGLASILLSPCHLASVPLMAGYAARDAADPTADGKTAGRRAALCGIAFTVGLFIIAAVGAVCALLGLLLGTVPKALSLSIGLLFIVLGLQTAGFIRLPIRPIVPAQFRLRGLLGAMVLGAGYGLLSGPCTFGFLAPVFAAATLPGNPSVGFVLLLAFALGHCLPIAAAGASTALCSIYLSSRFADFAQTTGRKAAGLLIAAAGRTRRDLVGRSATCRPGFWHGLRKDPSSEGEIPLHGRSAVHPGALKVAPHAFAEEVAFAEKILRISMSASGGQFKPEGCPAGILSKELRKN